MKYGVYNCLMTTYVKGTGIAVDAATLGLTKVLHIIISPTSLAESTHYCQWDSDNDKIVVYDTTDDAEIENGEVDGKTISIMYFGF